MLLFLWSMEENNILFLLIHSDTQRREASATFPLKSCCYSTKIISSSDLRKIPFWKIWPFTILHLLLFVLRTNFRKRIFYQTRKQAEKQSLTWILLNYPLQIGYEWTFAINSAKPCQPYRESHFLSVFQWKHRSICSKKFCDKLFIFSLHNLLHLIA